MDLWALAALYQELPTAVGTIAADLILSLKFSAVSRDRLRARHVVPRDLADVQRPHLAHDGGELAVHDLQHRVCASFAEGREAPNVRPADAEGASAQCERFQDVAPVWRHEVVGYWPRAGQIDCALLMQVLGLNIDQMALFAEIG
jgi:hypothetical protein